MPNSKKPRTPLRLNRNKRRPVRHVANILDESTGHAFEEFEIEVVGGGQKKVTIPRQTLPKISQLRDIFLQHNAELPNDVRDIEDALSHMNDTRQLVCAATMGWTKDKVDFVTARGSIGDTRPRLRAPSWLSDMEYSDPAPDGSLDEWIRRVANPAKWSSVSMLALAVAFAAPLLAIKGMNSCGIHIYGGSKAGKTVAAMMANSVGSGGSDVDMVNWSATDAALVEGARVFKDRVYCIDEGGLVTGTSGPYEKMRLAIYALSGGKEKRRHHKADASTRASATEFRVTFISTAEHSINEYARQAGRTRDAGETARCLDIRAVDPESGTIIDRYPKNIPEERRREWARKKVVAIREGCVANHGRALDAFVLYLLGHQVTEQIAYDVQEFMDEALNHSLDGPLIHAARNFALYYAAAAMAIDAKILPWKPKGAFDAIMACFRRAVEEVYQSGGAQRPIKEILLERLENADLAERNKAEPDDIGYFEMVGKLKRFAVRSTTFSDWFGPRVQEAILHLRSENLLVAKIGAKNGRDFERTPKWPGGRSVRAICFRDPLP